MIQALRRKLNRIVLLVFNLAALAVAKDVMLMNRIGPSKSELFVANPDGSSERKLIAGPGFDYHANYSADSKWIVFTSERAGDGQADIYRVHADGTGIERLTDSPALDDQGALSPDGSQVAFVSTRDTHRANIWILNLKTKQFRDLTGIAGIQGDPVKPDGFFRPAWSPDGQWIAFSSDRNTEWRPHSRAWEHTQELSIYIVRPDGTGLRKLTEPGVCSGAPKWSADGKEIYFHEVPLDNTWDARVFGLSARATSQIVSVEVASGKRTPRTTGPGLKLMPQPLPGGGVGFLTKAGRDNGVGYTDGPAKFPGSLRSPAWSPDGKQIVYEKIDYEPRPQNAPLYSWDPKYEYRYTDVFPSFSNDGTLVVTNKDKDSSVVIMDADGKNPRMVYKAQGPNGVAYSPAWSRDGQWIAFGFGTVFQDRNSTGHKIMIAKRDGSEARELTPATPNSGFPSFSADGKSIVYRTYGPGQRGLRIVNIDDKSVRTLTTANDNLPFWSPDGSRILFTRDDQSGNFDIYTIKPDGSDLRRLTTFPANDAHAVWTQDGKSVLWNSGEYGFKDEAVLYDNSFQPYGSIWMMNADGSNKRPLTDSHWEDAMPAFVPASSK